MKALINSGKWQMKRKKGSWKKTNCSHRTSKACLARLSFMSLDQELDLQVTVSKGEGSPGRMLGHHALNAGGCTGGNLQLISIVQTAQKKRINFKVNWVWDYIWLCRLDLISCNAFSSNEESHVDLGNERNLLRPRKLWNSICIPQRSRPA